MDYIKDRVGPFLSEKSDMWCSLGYIAVDTHLVHWQVIEQLNNLIDDGKVLVEVENGAARYRLKIT